MKYINIILLFLSFNIYSQTTKQSQIDSIVQSHVKELRDLIGADPVVFIDLKYQFSTDNIAVTPNDLFVEWGIDAKKLKNNKEYFMVRFLLKYEEGILKIEGINFRLKKISNKGINQINLMNGHKYSIAQ